MCGAVVHRSSRASFLALRGTSEHIQAVEIEFVWLCAGSPGQRRRKYASKELICTGSIQHELHATRNVGTSETQQHNGSDAHVASEDALYDGVHLQTQSLQVGHVQAQRCAQCWLVYVLSSTMVKSNVRQVTPTAWVKWRGADAQHMAKGTRHKRILMSNGDHKRRAKRIRLVANAQRTCEPRGEKTGHNCEDIMLL